MRLVKRLSHPDGSIEVTLSVGTTEDLWHLYNFVLPGDAVRTKTHRKVVKERSMGPAGAVVKVMALEVEVKQTEFSPDEMRVQGINRSENEFVRLGAYHTLTIKYDPPQNVTVVKKEWDEIQEERLREACNQESKADTVALLMSFGEAQLVVVTSSFIHTKAKVEVTIAKKHKNDGTARDRSIHRFFKQTMQALLTSVDFEQIKLVMLCSPGNVRDEFMQYLRTECRSAETGPVRTLFVNLGKFVLVKVNSSTIGGLREALLDPAVVARMRTTQCAQDIRVWDDFQSMMNHDPDRCVYTPQFVYHAALAGAVASLMISDAVFRSPDPLIRRFFLALANVVRRSGGATVSIFSSNHVTGEQLAQLGEVAALLHFPCPETEEIAVQPDFVHSDEAVEFVRANAPTRVTV